MEGLTIVSGINGKLPAAFLLKLNDYRILLDIGAGPEPGVFPDFTQIGQVDAICLSHSHIDHVGSLFKWRALGSPIIFATKETWADIEHFNIPESAKRILDSRGKFFFNTLEIVYGQSGHAPGSIWFHFPYKGGITYMGDWSDESILFAFDMPPKADILITDASYGDRDQSLTNQINIIADLAKNGAVLPVPSNGRGAEMVIRLQDLGLDVSYCNEVKQDIINILKFDNYNPDLKAKLTNLLQQKNIESSLNPKNIIVAADAVADSGLSAKLSNENEYNFIFTSHISLKTKAHTMVNEGLAIWSAWNVHPILTSQLNLINTTQAKKVIAAFVAQDKVNKLQELSSAPIVWDRYIPI